MLVFNELLAPKTVEDCNYILKCVEMINIYLDNYNIQNKLTYKNPTH